MLLPNVYDFHVRVERKHFYLAELINPDDAPDEYKV